MGYSRGGATGSGVSLPVAESDVTSLTTDLAAKAQRLTRTAVKTGNYSAAAGDLVPVDTTSGNVTVTLPTAPAAGSRVAVKHIILGGSNTITVACGGSDVFNKTGGGTTFSLTKVNQAAQFQYDSGGIWTVTADDLPLSTFATVATSGLFSDVTGARSFDGGGTTRTDTFLVRGATASAWTAANPTLAARELGFETDTRRFKEGDGATAWTSLLYVNATPDDVFTLTNSLTSGEANMPRDSINTNALTQATGVLRLNYFTARKTESITQCRTMSGSVAAAATPTLCRYGFYSVAANGDLTLVAAIANTTSLWAATATRYTTSLGTAAGSGGSALSATWAKVAGQRYAFATIVVSSTTTPTLHGFSSGISGALPITEMMEAPIRGLSLASQTDLPATIATATVAAGSAAGSVPYVAMIP